MNSYGHKSPYHTYEFANKVIRKAKLDKVTMIMAENKISGKIFVEFFTRSGKFKLQRNFNKLSDAETFANKFKSAEDLKQYFGMNL